MSDAPLSSVKTSLIIPCGTSQLEKLLGEEPALPCSDSTRRKVKEAFSQQLTVEPDEYLGGRLVKGAIDEIVGKLLTELRKELSQSTEARDKKVPAPQYVRDNWWAENPFGSELSTLIRLEDELRLAPRENYTPPHRLVLLASETPAGLMARRVLHRVLTEEGGYGLPAIPLEEERTALQRGAKEELVSGLTETPANPLEAEMSLVERIRRNLIPMTLGWRNLFLATGGFKSVLPCLTMLSLLYGIEMIYLFEHSPQVQRFQLVEAETAEEKEAWRQKWLKLREDGKLKPSGCLETIFENWSQPEKKKVEPLFM